MSCSHKQTYRCEHPSRDELKKMVRELSFVDIGKKFNVTDNAVRKWCKSENIPYRKADIKKISDDEWQKI